METSKTVSKNLWKPFSYLAYRLHVTGSGESITNSDVGRMIVRMEDLKKREVAYGICGECNEPGTGERWCQACNAKRFKDNFKNWTSGNKDIDELIQYSQLNATHCLKCLHWVPFESFQNVTYIARGGFGKVYKAFWKEGRIYYWDIEKQEWERFSNVMTALKCLNGSNELSSEFLNEIKSLLQINLIDIIRCHGITQNPTTKDYMMILDYCDDGNLRNYLNNSEGINCGIKIDHLSEIARGLLDIHNAGKVHKDFHSGNILFQVIPIICDLGMCQPANCEEKKNEIHGVLPYMAPEVLRGHRYTKASDIYSFGIVMNEYISEEIPFGNIAHNYILAVKICTGHRPKISNDTPNLLKNLITRCWDAKVENRPTSNELYQILTKLSYARSDERSEIYFQIKEYEKIKDNLKNGNEKKIIKPHPQAFYTSRLIDFANLPEPINSTDLSSSVGGIPITSTSLITEGFDCQLSESDLYEINQEGENIE